MSDWNIDEARLTYNVAHWGEGYIDINEQGNVLVHPDTEPQGKGIDLYRLAQELRQHQNLTLPILLRFTDILHNRVDALCRCFTQAIEEVGYQGGYTAVYPIKVNQQHSVVQQIIQYGKDKVGLEAGSKPELMAVLGLADANNGIIVCNGYKDREYVRLALIGQKLGHRVFIVIEKRSELELILEESAKLNVNPLLGIRVRLATIGKGKWQNTGGEKSKFGLSAAQVMHMIQRLEQAGQLASLQMLHFHLGSQLANIRDIQRGMHECARYYAELHRLGVVIRYVDVGGGLGVDYEGTRSRSACSVNYSIQSYASNIVHPLWEICEQHHLPHPHIMTESGRAMTAHHAVLITNVIDTEAAPEPESVAKPDKNDHVLLHDLWNAYNEIQAESSGPKGIEHYHDAVHWLVEVQTMYSHGVVTLEQRARAEGIYFAICRKAQKVLNHSKRSQREVLDELNEKLADKYFCNFSLFQSAPDVWAIEQVFPVMPLHRLNEQPDRRAIIEDITCDSDGRIDNYVDSEGIESSLPIHSLREGEDYLLGIFMVGAYQEILGDMHNLFGDTDSVHVSLDENGDYTLSEPLYGDTVDAVLRYVHFNAHELLAEYQHKINKSDLSQHEQQLFINELKSGLSGYTYLED